MIDDNIVLINGKSEKIKHFLVDMNKLMPNNIDPDLPTINKVLLFNNFRVYCKFSSNLKVEK